MFIGNLHTLQTVNLLYLLHDVARQRFDALQTQNIVRIHSTINDGFAAVHHLAVVHQNLFLFGNQGFVSHAVQIGDDQALFAFGFFTEGNGTGYFGQHTGIFRYARFKQLGHTRQTTGNIAGFRRGLRDTRQYITLADFLIFTHGNHRAHRESHRYGGIGTRNLHFQAVFIQQFHGRTQQFRSAGRTAFAVNHYQGGQTGNVVGLLGYGYTVFDVFEFHATSMLGNHRTGMRIPSGQCLAGFHARAVLYQQSGTVRYFMALALAADIVVNHHFRRAADHNQLAFVVGYITHLAVETRGTVRLGFYLAGGSGTRSGTTDVEGTHGQLGTRLTDRLGGNHADGFAGIHQLTACQVTAVTLCTQAVTGFTGNRGTDFHFIDTRVVN